MDTDLFGLVSNAVEEQVACCSKQLNPSPHGPRPGQAIPGVSDWVLGVIKLGYTLKFD